MADDAYETFQYENLAFRATHPDWLGTVGRLFGMDPAPAERCRVLELGCGPGGNLMPLAELLPDSEFVGIDLSAAHIARARADAAALGLTNVRFEAMDILDVPDWGPFDYVICHGVFSWVSDAARARILAIAREQLAPQGIAFVSYNTLPGWHARGMLRAILRRVVPAGPAPEMAATARTFLRILREQTPERLPLGAWLQGELELLEQLSDRYLYFEYLVEENEPLYFDEFLQRASDAGLGYLGDSDLGSMLPTQLGDRGAAFVDAITRTQIEQEQLLDYLTIRYFRRTLLCHREVELDRELSSDALLDGWVGTESLRVETPLGDPVDDAGPLLTDTTELAFRGSDGYGVTSSDVLSKVMLHELMDAQPQGLPLSELEARVRTRLAAAADDPADPRPLARRLADRAMRMLLQGRLETGRWLRPVAIRVPRLPRTTALVRHQAATGVDSVVGPRHDHHPVDMLDRVLLAAMDGHHDLDALLTAVVDARTEGRLQISAGEQSLIDSAALRELVEQKLEQLCRRGLILEDIA